MTDRVNDELPPLPEPPKCLISSPWPTDYINWADQMRAYARAAVLAERERNAEIVLQELGDTGQAKAIAAAIRAETKSPE